MIQIQDIDKIKDRVNIARMISDAYCYGRINVLVTRNSDKDGNWKANGKCTLNYGIFTPIVLLFDDMLSIAGRGDGQIAMMFICKLLEDARGIE